MLRRGGSNPPEDTILDGTAYHTLEWPHDGRGRQSGPKHRSGMSGSGFESRCGHHMKRESRLAARAMRSEGKAITEIAAILGVAKSSVFLWTRDLPVPEPFTHEHKAAIGDANRAKVIAKREARKALFASKPDVVRFGPYVQKTGHMFWSVVNRLTRERHSVLIHREVMEHHLGRKLAANEVVHHKDGNPANNAIENLVVKDLAQHSSGHANPPRMATFACAWCGKEQTKRAAQIRANQTSRGCYGPFCDKSCSGKWSRSEQIRSGHVNLRA